MSERQVGSFGPTIAAEVLEGLGYAVVHPTSVPSDGSVTEGKPELIDGKWQQVWSKRPFTPEEESAKLENAKNQCLGEIRSLRSREFTVGFPHQFPGREDVLHVQMGGQDRSNIWVLRMMAKEALEQNDTDWMVEFRVYEDVEVTMSAEEMVALGDLAAVQLQKAYKASWVLKDKVAKATAIEEFPVLPETLF